MVNIQTYTASQIQLDSDFFLIIRENMLWRIHWFILVEGSPNMYCQLEFRNFLITSLGFSSKYVVDSSFIHNFFNWFIWGFHENMWWIVELSKSKLVLPTWFRNFSDCFLPIWRAFVVVYDLLHQAIHSGPSGR